ncbi:MAG: hypothetical protein K2L55_07220 [Muribaculaceae bacterium]|nr:hypothetical protein [Muribaculaceae bacterium]
MNPEDYVSYPIALALKKAGFDWKCDHYYTPEIYSEKYIEYPMLLWEKTAINSNDIIYEGERFSAPTLWQAQKWLREKWDLHIDVFPAGDCSFDADGHICEEWNYWNFDIMHVVSTRKIIESEERYDSFEEVLSAGIAAALELIEKKGA